MSLEPKDPVALTQALIHCESVTPAEGGALTLLESVLKPAGFVCHRMTMREPGTADVENLYARFGSAAPNLCFAGHTDVVPTGDPAKWSSPPFAADIRDGHIIGRGAVDMKGGIACFIAAALALIAERKGHIGGSVSLLITGDEEGPSINGTMKVLDWLKARGEKLDAALVGEPSNPKALGDEIKIGRRGSLTGEIIVLGKQGHAAYPHQADNPVPKLVKILAPLTNGRLDDGTPDFEATNLEITVIGASTAAANVIPGEARAQFNVRYNTTWTRPKLEAHLRGIVEREALDAGASVRLVFSGTGDVFLTRPGPLIEHMRKAVAAETGRSPRLTTGGGTSDARFIQAYCPVIEFGLVNQTIHAIDERVALGDLTALTRIYRGFLEGYLGGEGRP